MQRLLIFARHYPPAVSGGARRPFLLARGLRARGIDVRILAPSLPEDEPGWAVPHPQRDPAPGTGDAPRFDLRAIGRDLLLWPDPDIRWCQRAARVVSTSGWKPDVVLTTSPPESIHFAGASLARTLGAAWIADFRDLWLDAPHRLERLSPHRQWGERMMARRLLPKADAVIAVDAVVAAEAEKLGARHADVLSHFTSSAPVVPYGFERGTVNLVHAGSIALSDPSARLGDLIGPFESAAQSRPELRLHLVGRINLAERQRIDASPAKAQIITHGPLPYDEARAMMAGADGLALVGSAKMHVPPSKIADYLAFGAPILSFGEGPWRADPRLPRADETPSIIDLNPGGQRRGGGKPVFEDAAAGEFLAIAGKAILRNQP